VLADRLKQAVVPDVVLELGTAQSMPGRPTHHRDWFPAARWVMSDYATGADVDVAGDAHRLPFRDEAFDVVVACSVWEHLARPWIATCEAARVLRRGGALYVQTHQTFPIHGYPDDYWRFTREAMAVLAADAGLEVVETAYEYRAHIEPPDVVFDRGWNTAAPSWLNVELLAVRS
jgi:SAM-dependent methyltransferase